MASWWAGVWRWPEVVGNVEPLLIPSRSTYEGQGHCFALSRLASDQAVAVLKRYLDEYLPRTDIYYDQVWAMAALVMVERERGGAVADRYWDMWQAWVADKPHDLTSVTETLDRMHHFADRVAGG
jgi:hypothetical protein